MENSVLSNTILIIYILLWIIVFFIQKKHTTYFGPCLFVILTYVVYSVLSFLLYQTDERSRYGQLSFFPLAYLFIMLIIALCPGIKYERSEISRIQKPSMIILYSFFIVYGICTIATLPSAISDVRSGLFLILNNADAGAQIYKEARQNAVSSDGSISGILGFFTIIHNLFRDISIFALFYYLSLKERIRSISIYLIVVLVVDILISIARGGRTTFMMIIFSIAIAYFIFKEYWPDKQRKIVKKIIPVAMVLLLIPFMALTSSRFGNNTGNNAAINSIINYAGMANLNFDTFVFDSNGIRYGDRTANEFKRMLGFDVPAGIRETRIKYSNMSISDAKFYTFVGDFVLDYGPIVTAILFCVFSAIICYMSRTRDGSIPFHKLLLVYFSLCVCSQGGMYLFYYSFIYNLVILAFLLMYIVFYFDYRIQRGGHSYIEVTDENTKLKKRRIRFYFGRNHR